MLGQSVTTYKTANNGVITVLCGIAAVAITYLVYKHSLGDQQNDKILEDFKIDNNDGSSMNSTPNKPQGSPPSSGSENSCQGAAVA